MHEFGHFNKDCPLPSANSLLFFAEKVKKKPFRIYFLFPFREYSRVSFSFLLFVCLFFCLFFVFVLTANMVLKSESAPPARHDVF